MTTATARSARPGIGRSVPLENGENGFELGAQVLDGLGRERAARLRLQVPAAPILFDLLARPLDRVFLGVEQMLHQHDQLDLAPLIHPFFFSSRRRHTRWTGDWSSDVCASD